MYEIKSSRFTNSHWSKTIVFSIKEFFVVSLNTFSLSKVIINNFIFAYLLYFDHQLFGGD